ncbi:unnamed protein product [Rhizoctonia solani]|uniref:Uncharacterized protein n=1 Tax=Rhizoctonia solani TaxID=456999 RepID=A0A8H3CFB1_9AGAM|nr:unnamed protein product [Rhizoctonia solani]
MSTLHPPPGSHPDPALGPLPDNTFLLGGSLAGISVSTDPKRILESCPNLFQLLEVVNERGFDGPVEKIVISQESFGRCLNVLLPGSYTSISKIDLKSLDNLSIKPTGVYGDPLEIIMFLQKVGYLHSNLAAVLFQTIKSSSANAALSSGLYLALDPKHGAQSSNEAYIIYWPEDTTWDDQAASPSVRHNRVTFMHYLDKLADQTLALVSSSQAQAFVWDATARSEDLPEGQQASGDSARVFDFEVEHLFEKEDAVASPGFTVAVEPRLLYPATSSQVRMVPGEQKAALLVVKHEREQPEEKRFESNISALNLRKMVESRECPLQLGNLAPSDLEILAAHGLRDKYRGIFTQYDERLQELNAERSRSESADKQHIRNQISGDRPMIKEEIQNTVRIQYNKLYPLPRFGFDISHGAEVTALLHRRYPGLNNVANEITRKYNLAIVRDSEFRSLKGQWPSIKEYLEKNPRLSEDEQKHGINNIIGPSDTHRSGRWGLIALAFTTNIQTGIPDPEFFSQLRVMGQSYLSLFGFMKRVYGALERNLEELETEIIKSQSGRIISTEESRLNMAASAARDHEYQEQTKRAFEVVVRELKEAMTSNARQIRHVNWISLIHRPKFPINVLYRWSGSVTILHPAQNRYNIYPLELTEQDNQMCRVDEAHVPQPRLNMRHRFEFTLLKGRAVEFMQLICNKCLVIVSEQGRTRIYIEDNVTINHALNTTYGQVSLSHESLGGSQCKFAFDQTTRLLAIVHGQKDSLMLSIFIFDELFTNLQSRGPPISLRGWYGNNHIDLSAVLFLSGVEEICLVETSGCVRIFLLITQVFRSPFLQID